MCILFEYNHQIIFDTFSTKHFSDQSKQMLGILCVQLLLEFVLKLQMFWPLFEHVHMAGYYPLITFFYFS